MEEFVQLGAFPLERKKGRVCKARGGKTPCGFINEVISPNESLGRQAQVGEVRAGPVEERCHFPAFYCPSLPARPEDSRDAPLGLCSRNSQAKLLGIIPE